jgi:hypothetical protein
MKKTITLIVFAGLSFLADAETNCTLLPNIKTLKNNCYTNVSVISSDEEKVRIKHDGGYYYIYWDELSEEDKRRLNYLKAKNIPETNNVDDINKAAHVELPISVSNITSLDGTVYSNVIVKSITTDLHDPSIRFIHSDGVSTIAVSNIKREKHLDTIFLLTEQSKANAKKIEDDKMTQIDNYNNNILLLKQSAKSGEKLTPSDWELILKDSNKDKVKALIGNPDSHSEMTDEDAHPFAAMIVGRGTPAGLKLISRWYYRSRVKMPPDEFKNPQSGDLILDFKDAGDHSELDVIQK